MYTVWSVLLWRLISPDFILEISNLHAAHVSHPRVAAGNMQVQGHQCVGPTIVSAICLVSLSLFRNSPMPVYMMYCTASLLTRDCKTRWDVVNNKELSSEYGYWDWAYHFSYKRRFFICVLTTDLIFLSVFVMYVLSLYAEQMIWNNST